MKPALQSTCSLTLAVLLFGGAVAAGGQLSDLERIEAKDLRREEETARLFKTPLFELAPACDTELRPTALLDEWRQRNTVDGVDVSVIPGLQVALQTSGTIRIVGAYRYQRVRGLLKPSVYLQSGGFDKILVLADSQWPRAWYRELLRDVGDRSVLAGFHNPLGEPDFDGIKEFVETFRSKIWAVAPAWSLASNVMVWNAPAPAQLMTPEPAVDPEYNQTAKHIWAVTNLVNRNWPEIPVCVFMCENRYTNEAFVNALRFRPSAFLADNGLNYQWGSGKVTPSRYKNSAFRMSAFDAIRRGAPDTPIICLGQSVRLKAAGVSLAQADERLKREAGEFFDDAARNGYAGACLSIYPNKKGKGQ